MGLVGSNVFMDFISAVPLGNPQVEFRTLTLSRE
jgi:hypothetical protein